jgi:ubiquinone/menaquinone biosynthesis C-methylase UbiE
MSAGTVTVVYPAPDRTPPTRPALAETLAVYDVSRAAYDDGADRPAAARFADPLTPGSLVLDAGCGTGADARVLLAACHRVVALDASPGMLATAALHCPAAVRGNFAALPLRSASVDASWANAAFVHLDATECALAIAELVRVTVPGGTIEVSLKARRSGEPVERWVTDRVGRRWFRFWTAAELAAVAAGVGLVAVRTVVEPDRTRDLDWVRLCATVPHQPSHRARPLPGQ